MDDIKQNTTIRIIVSLASLVVITAGMHFARPVLVPLILAVFISIICTPPLFWLQEKGIPKILAVLIVVSGILLLGFLIGMIVGASLNDFYAFLPVYKVLLQQKLESFSNWAQSYGFDINPLEYLNMVNILGFARDIFIGIGGFLNDLLIILFTIIFILFESSSFSKKFNLMLHISDSSFEGFDRFMNSIKHYMLIRTFTSILVGVAITLWMAVLGVDYALLWGFIAFLLNYITYFGPIIAAFPAVILVLIESGVWQFIVAVLGYLIVNVIVGYIIEPRLMGKRLGLSTLVVLFSLILWGWILGTVGMLLSVPLTMSLKLAFDSSAETRWISILLGPEIKSEIPPPPKE